MSARRGVRAEGEGSHDVVRGVKLREHSIGGLGRLQSISASHVASETRRLSVMASAIVMCPASSAARCLARPPHSGKSGQGRWPSGWQACWGPQCSRASTTPQRRSWLRAPAAHSSSRSRITPCVTCMVERHSTLPVTNHAPHRARRGGELRQPQTSWEKRSTSSQRSFCMRVPRTLVWLWARSSTVLPFLRCRRVSVMRPSTSAVRWGLARVSKEPAQVGVHALALLLYAAAQDADLDAGLKDQVEERGDVPRKRPPPPRLAQRTQSMGAGGVGVGVVSVVEGVEVVRQPHPSEEGVDEVVEGRGVAVDDSPRCGGR